MNLMST